MRFLVESRNEFSETNLTFLLLGHPNNLKNASD